MSDLTQEDFDAINEEGDARAACFPKTHTEYAITLGIFDDGDKVPTVVFGIVIPYPDCDLLALCREMCHELLKAARNEYHAPIPKHAAFWSGSTRQVENQ